MTGRKKTAALAAGRRPRKANGQRSVAGASGVPPSAPAGQPMPGTSGTGQLQGEIEFQGRTLKVRMPETEQLVVWRRIWQRLEKFDQREGVTGLEVMNLLERVREIIDSVLVDPADVDWLDGQMLSGQVKMNDATKILVEAVASFQNREQRRAAKTASPARRKKG